MFQCIGLTRGVRVTLLVAFARCAHAQELSASGTGDARKSLDNLLNKLVKNSLSKPFSDLAGLDSALLGKSAQVATPASRRASLAAALSSPRFFPASHRLTLARQQLGGRSWPALPAGQSKLPLGQNSRARAEAGRPVLAAERAIAAASARSRTISAATAVEEALSFDERLVTENPTLVKDSLAMRRASPEQLAAVDRIGELSKERSTLIYEKDKQLSVRKTLSSQIGKLMKEGKKEEAEKIKAEVNVANAQADAAEEKLASIEEERSMLFSTLPNLLDPRVKDGADENANEEVGSWGTDGDLPVDLKWHDEVATALGGLDIDAAAQMSGSRFSVLRGSVARLERALVNFFVDMHTEQHNYTEVSVPYLVGGSALQGTGQLPKFEEDLFKLKEPLNGRDGYLIPTAEVPVTNLHAGKILEESDLPLSYTAYTPCFRAEAGSYGKDTRGLFRQHQFNKVELVKITTPEQSDKEHHLLVQHAEKCLQALGLPYRKVQLCSGDIGFSARLCYDLEVWLPAQGKFREVSSCSNCGDFQARRMGLRYRPAAKDAKGKPLKPVHCHTMNGSGLAVGRTLIAILENYQNEDGSVTIPEVLRPYMGGKDKIFPK